jgi:hypothetical protein
MNRTVADLLLATLVAGLASASGPRPEFEQYRAVPESINYHYSEEGAGGPCAYGQMVLPGDQSPPTSLHLDVGRTAEVS